GASRYMAWAAATRELSPMGRLRPRPCPGQGDPL
ncbi:uncharacterized protein METZ01_LOCUS433475, partial [marine metagenome]